MPPQPPTLSQVSQHSSNIRVTTDKLRHELGRSATAARMEAPLEKRLELLGDVHAAMTAVRKALDACANELAIDLMASYEKPIEGTVSEPI